VGEGADAIGTGLKLTSAVKCGRQWGQAADCPALAGAVDFASFSRDRLEAEASGNQRVSIDFSRRRRIEAPGFAVDFPGLRNSTFFASC
jgi:hypothetical protein